MGKEVAPPLDVQFEEILTFTIDQCYKNRDIFDLPISAPLCEKKIAPAKYGPQYGMNNNLPHRKSHISFMGHPVPDSGRCPHCDCLYFSKEALGTVMACIQCHKDFVW